MMTEIHKIHLIGAGGIGVSAVGKLFLRLGKVVSGSDLAHNEQVDALRQLGAAIAVGQGVDDLTADVDLVIYSPAVPFDNVERVRARERGLVEMSYPQFLGELCKEYKTIAVSGTHGKSTTTAMIGLILEAAGMDPTVIVGSKVKSWVDGNLRFGRQSGLPLSEGEIEGVGGRPLLIVEACEHMAGMLNIHPDIAVITNVEMDHPDFYRDLAHVQETFAAWMQQSDEIIVSASGAKQSLEIASSTGSLLAKTNYFGSDEPHLDGLTLLIPGEFNLMNAHAAAAVAKRLGVDDETIVKTLNAFPGLWRRFEKVCVWHEADIYSDYAHHPTAIAATLKGAHAFFPDRRIVLCFQPHQHARTKELFDAFVPSFDGADKIILVEIYAVAGRLEVRGEISSRDLVEEVKKRGKDVVYASNLDSAEGLLRDVIKPGDVVIIMGAGDIDDVARRFV